MRKMARPFRCNELTSCGTLWRENLQETSRIRGKNHGIFLMIQYFWLFLTVSDGVLALMTCWGDLFSPNLSLRDWIATKILPFSPIHNCVVLCSYMYCTYIIVICVYNIYIYIYMCNVYIVLSRIFHKCPSPRVDPCTDPSWHREEQMMSEVDLALPPGGWVERDMWTFFFFKYGVPQKRMVL